MQSDWCKIYLAHARYYLHQEEVPLEIISHLWYVAAREGWDEVKRCMLSWVSRDVWKRIGLGQWSEVDILPHHFSKITTDCWHLSWFGDRCASLEHGEIELQNDDGEVIAHRVVEGPPTGAWGVSREVIAFSSDGESLWYLGYQNGVAHVFLFATDGLELIADFSPVVGQFYQCDTYRIRDWCEPTVHVSEHNPSVLLIRANEGGQQALFFALQVLDDEGDVVLVGSSLTSAGLDCIDEQIWGAEFVGPDRLLVLDNVGRALLFSWPDLQVCAESMVIQEELQDEDWKVQVWPEEERVDFYQRNLVVLEYTNVMCGALFLPIYDDDHGDGLLALASLDATNLEFQGLIRPPVCDVHRLVHVEGNLWGAKHRGKYRVWRYEPFL